MSEASEGVEEAEFPEPTRPGQTHYEGCWKTPGHHNCAVAKIHDLRARRDELREQRNRWRGAAAEISGAEVRALEACDELLEAAEAVAEAEDTANNRFVNLRKLRDAMPKVHAAIAKAEGKEAPHGS